MQAQVWSVVVGDEAKRAFSMCNLHCRADDFPTCFHSETTALFAVPRITVANTFGKSAPYRKINPQTGSLLRDKLPIWRR